MGGRRICMFLHAFSTQLKCYIMSLSCLQCTKQIKNLINNSFHKFIKFWGPLWSPCSYTNAVYLIFKISISWNTTCAHKIGFHKSSHNYDMVYVGKYVLYSLVLVLTTCDILCKFCFYLLFITKNIRTNSL